MSDLFDIATAPTEPAPAAVIELRPDRVVVTAVDDGSGDFWVGRQRGGREFGHVRYTRAEVEALGSEIVRALGSKR